MTNLRDRRGEVVQKVSQKVTLKCLCLLPYNLGALGIQILTIWTRKGWLKQTVWHIPRQLLRPKRIYWASWSTPSKNPLIFSLSVFSSVPEILGWEVMPNPESPWTSWVGFYLGFHSLVIKSLGFPGRSLQSWEKQEFLLPTYLLLHKRKQSCLMASEAHYLSRSWLWLRSTCKEMLISTNSPLEKKSPQETHWTVTANNWKTIWEFS